MLLGIVLGSAVTGVVAVDQHSTTTPGISLSGVAGLKVDTASSSKPVPPTTQPPTAGRPAAQKTDFAVLLRQAISQVPGAVSTKWIVKDLGAWGSTHFPSCTVYIAPRTPEHRLLDVIRHEWGHVKQCRRWGTIESAQTAVGNIEVNADCIARLLGAKWTHYVKSCTKEQFKTARYVLNS